MLPGGGKRKGGAFERTVCKALSRWVTHGKREDVFWRSAMSGGRATVRGKDVRQSGDVTCVAPEGHVLTDRFVIECKHVRTLDVFAFMLLQRGQLWKFWVKLIAEAMMRNKYAMLIGKQNNKPIIVLTDSPHIVGSQSMAVTVYNSPPVHMILFDDMLKMPFKAQVNGRVKAHQTPQRRILEEE